MRINSVLAGLIVAASLAACGGGGSSDASAQAQSAEGLTGTFDEPSGAILPDPATTTDPINVTIETSFRGTISPVVSSFTIPAVIRQVGTSVTHTVTIKCTLTSGIPGSGVHACTGATTLPMLAAGSYEFGLRLDPGSKYTFSGRLPAEVFGTVTVAASEPR